MTQNERGTNASELQEGEQVSGSAADALWRIRMVLLEGRELNPVRVGSHSVGIILDASFWA